jgi:hypothetical protein
MLAKEREKMSDDLLRETSQVRDILQNDQKTRDEERLSKDKQVPFLEKVLVIRQIVNILKHIGDYVKVIFTFFICIGPSNPRRA